MIDETVYLGRLYDVYGELLTEKQREFFEAYYFENLTLQEIADEDQISKNAVHKALVGLEEKLRYYEEKLQLVAKIDKIEETISEEEIKKKILDILL